jgi:uncharacterized protein YciI
MATQASEARPTMAAMLNKTLFVALREPRDLRRAGELLQAHLEWAVQVERRGELFASGPFAAEGCPPGAAGGMSIVRAGSHAEAQAILDQDPFVREGVVAVTIRKWIVMEGGMTVTVRFSDQSARLL